MRATIGTPRTEPVISDPSGGQRPKAVPTLSAPRGHAFALPTLVWGCFCQAVFRFGSFFLFVACFCWPVSRFDRGTVSPSRPRFLVAARRYFGRAGHRGRSLPVSIKGELAKRLRSFRSNLVFGDLFGSDHDAVMRIGGEAPKGGPNLHERYEGHGWARDTATSDRHRQRLARGGRAPIGLSLGWLHRFRFAPQPRRATASG
jgi:hypothetical protein